MCPISGLTNAPKAFMKLGQIRKGDREGKNGAPRDLDHFRVTFQPGALKDQIETAFLAKYGKAPTELNVRFASQNIGEVWDANYECYKQGGLIASCATDDTGAHWLFYRDPDDSEVLVRNGSAVGERGRTFYDKPIDLTAPIYFNSKGEGVFLEPVGRLQVVIPEVAHIAVGFFVFQPGSPRDIRNITAELGAYDAIAKSYGKSITGIPFILRRRQEEITRNIGGKLSKGPSWVVHLDAGGEWGQRAIETIERLALPDVIDAEYEDVEENDSPLYQEDVPGNVPMLVAATLKPTPSEGDVSIDPLSARAIEYAAKAWNVSPKDARAQIAENMTTFTNPMNKNQFKRIVNGEA